MLIKKQLLNFPFEAVLWDMDGTLIDSEPLWIEQERLLMRSFDVHWTEEDAIHCLGGPMPRVENYMRSKLSQEIVASLTDSQLTNTLLRRMEERFKKGIEFAGGSELLLNEIHSSGVPQALVSASSRALVDSALSAIGEHFFHITVSNDDVANPKPNPEGYLKAAEHIGVEISRCLIIEDSVTGVNAGIAAGAFVLGIPHVSKLPSAPKVKHHNTLSGLQMKAIPELFGLNVGEN